VTDKSTNKLYEVKPGGIAIPVIDKEVDKRSREQHINDAIFRVDEITKSVERMGTAARRSSYEIRTRFQILNRKAWNRIFPPNRLPRGQRDYT